ncbi:MAG: hypothetical protein CMH55_00790, partial [Myxococcales bacterium]|nr:hypothetical protein [Myxococcales bacterium]
MLLVLDHVDRGSVSAIRKELAQHLPRNLRARVRIVSDGSRLLPELASREGGSVLPATLSYGGHSAHPLRRYWSGLLGQDPRLTVGRPIRIETPIADVAARVQETLEREKQLHIEPSSLSPKAVATSIAAELAPNDKARRKRIRKIVQEMAADLNMATIRTFSRLLDRVFPAMFSGLDFDRPKLEIVRERIRTGPVIFCPSHRSHVDYLVLSYALVKHGIIPPLIAAGENMNFWPFGAWFRSSGAFFIRRSFRDDPDYRLAFAAYLRYLMLSGISLEFFPEGTRSRTGKCMPPRFGVFNAVLEAYKLAPEALEKVAVVPVDINYERVPELAAHVRERAGGEKSKESATQVFKALGVLRGGYGWVRLSFGRAIPIGAFLRQQKLDVSVLDERRVAAARLAYKTLSGIIEASPKSAVGLIALVLLAADERALAPQTVLRRAERLLAALGRDVVLEDKGDDPLASALDFLKAGGFTSSLGDGRLVVRRDRRAALAFMRNQAIHAFVPGAILLQSISDCLETNGVALVDPVLERARFYSSLLRHEFVFPQGTIEANLFAAGRRLMEAGIVTTDGTSFEPVDGTEMNALRRSWMNCIADILDGYRGLVRAINRRDRLEPLAKLKQLLLEDLRAQE